MFLFLFVTSLLILSTYFWCLKYLSQKRDNALIILQNTVAHLYQKGKQNFKKLLLVTVSHTPSQRFPLIVTVFMCIKYGGFLCCKDFSSSGIFYHIIFLSFFSSLVLLIYYLWRGQKSLPSSIWLSYISLCLPFTSFFILYYHAYALYTLTENAVSLALLIRLLGFNKALICASVSVPLVFVIANSLDTVCVLPPEIIFLNTIEHALHLIAFIYLSYYQRELVAGKKRRGNELLIKSFYREICEEFSDYDPKSLFFLFYEKAHFDLDITFTRSDYEIILNQRDVVHRFWHRMIEQVFALKNIVAPHIRLKQKIKNKSIKVLAQNFRGLIPDMLLDQVRITHLNQEEKSFAVPVLPELFYQAVRKIIKNATMQRGVREIFVRMSSNKRHLYLIDEGRQLSAYQQQAFVNPAATLEKSIDVDLAMSKLICEYMNIDLSCKSSTSKTLFRFAFPTIK